MSSNPDHINFERVRLIVMEPGETIALTTRGASVVRSSTLCDVPTTPEDGYVYICTHRALTGPTSQNAASMDQSSSPTPTVSSVALSSEEGEPEESDTESSQAGAGSDTTEDYSQSFAASTRASDPPPPYVVPRPVPEGLVRVYAAFNRVPSPHEVANYWPHELNKKAYLVVEGCRIGFFPSCTLAQPFVDRVSRARHLSFSSFSDALQVYTNCYNQIAPYEYPRVSAVPPGARTNIVNFDDQTLQGDIEIAVDEFGRTYCFAMGSQESAQLNRFTIVLDPTHVIGGVVLASIGGNARTFIGPPIDIHDSDSEDGDN
ncbi:hypothetical protein VKT23_020243 [Stygiomarasmius scandens]|uniref:Uncharacterized protein n=1 Tax=Marasmiellus scandens TaxID=2682957 RepID=A0ABR1IJF3_9AGAR